MKRHVFIIVRYSMLTIDGADWRIGRKNIDSYEKEVLNQERLARREQLFKKITLPSIINQSNLSSSDLTLLVITSDKLPKDNLNNLQNMIKDYSWAKIIKVSNNDTMVNLIENVIKSELENFDEQVCYSTTRLDDDDALSNDFLNELNRYLDPKYNGFCVSFGKGYIGIFNEKYGGYESFHQDYFPKIAIGLSLINTFDPSNKHLFNEKITIFNCGNHRKVDYESPTILESTIPLYLRTIHTSSDTSNSEQFRKMRSKPIVDPGLITKDFSFEMKYKSFEETTKQLKEEFEKTEMVYKEKIDAYIVQIDKANKQLEKCHKDIKREIDINKNLTKKIDELRNDVNRVSKEKKSLFREVKTNQIKLDNIQQSRTWRYTKSLRIIMDFIKAVRRKDKTPKSDIVKTSKTITKKSDDNSEQNNCDKKGNNYTTGNIQDEIQLIKLIDTANSDEIYSVVSKLVEERKSIDKAYIKAFIHAAKLFSKDRSKKNVFKKVISGLKIEELPHFIIKDAGSIPVHQASSFKVNMSIRSRKAQLGGYLPEWILNNKSDAYKFIDTVQIARPWRSESFYRISTIPQKEGVVIKPTQGAACRGVYFVFSNDRIWDVKRSRNLDSWTSLIESMKEDLSSNWVENDEWLVEELLCEDKEMTKPARDIKFFSFYGKIGMILEVVRLPETKYCYWTPEGETIRTGVFNNNLFKGEGVSQQEIDLVQELSSKIPAPFMRIDFLKTKDGLKFGEFTPRPGTYTSFDWKTDKMLGELFLDAEARLINDLLNGKSFKDFNNYKLALNSIEKD